jgi:hypothetical protein
MDENTTFADDDKGVIYDILKLTAEVRIKEAVGLLTQRLYDLVKKDVPASKIYIEYGISDGIEMKVDDIDEKLNKAFLEKEWTYPKLITRVRATCFSPNRTHLPDREFMTPENIAEHFQVKKKLSTLRLN